MSRRTILVVDDSPTELRLLSHALEERGFDVLTAQDGDQALEQIMHSRPNLVLLDVVMPKRNGFQVCRQIKNSPETRTIKVILLTGKSQETDRYWGLKQGADEYITKPFVDEELFASVERLLA